MKFFFIYVLIIIAEASAYSQEKPNSGTAIIAHNLGPAINSKSHEFLPYLSRDGLTMYFVSLRSLGKSQIFVSKRKARDSVWGESEYYKLLNYKDAVNGIAFDDLGRVYCASSKGITGNLNIWEGDTRADKITMEMLPEPVNTIKLEMSPSITRDGKDLYFASDREVLKNAAHIGTDIFVAHRNVDRTWTEPQNLGTNVNFGEYNSAPYISPDGRFLFFASKEKRKLNVKTKIYMSERTGPKNTDWSPAVLLPSGINSEDHNDTSPMVASDGKTIYFASDRNEGNGFDIFEATLPQDIQDKIFHSFPGY
jgi:ribosomal protein L24E